MTSNQVHVLGIRHHGPGSTKNMIKALQQIKPDALVIEIPLDAEPALKFIGQEQISPPVALLVYNPKLIEQASYLPFASFSPEWQAILYAHKTSIPVFAMDLPLSIQLEQSNQFRDNHFFKIKKEDEEIVKDPLGYLAKIEGYLDGESWWNVYFEQRENDETIFDTILELIKTLRKETSHVEDRANAVREAHMRKILRKVIKNGFQKIAVVCGAWHAPVLNDWGRYSVKSDNALLKGLKKVKTEASWVPWSYDRLARNSGYGAGVIAPAWYELIFGKRKELVIRWMTKVARLLRKEGFTASTAHIENAVQLAYSLAQIRNLEIPGIRDLEEASRAVFTDGNSDKLQLINQKLIIGDRIGKVGPKIPKPPILKDLEQKIKSARLTKEWNTTEKVRKDLDLRKPANKTASLLLHRLIILNIKWASLRKGSQFKLGSFSEHWTFKRRTDAAIQLIAAGMWGNTIQEAAQNLLIQESKNQPTLAFIGQSLEQALKADLTIAITKLAAQIKEVSAITKDVIQLLDSLPSLVQIVRYGNIRGTDTESIQEILDQMIPRILTGILNTLINLDDSLAETRFQQIIQTNRAIVLLHQKEHLKGWNQTLVSIQNASAIHPLIKGLTLRLLFDRELLSSEEVFNKVQFALSLPQENKEKAYWMEGFLNGSGQMLIHHPPLWNLIDSWVQTIPMDIFQELLPLLRRTFSNFSIEERKKILQLAKKQESTPTNNLRLLPLSKDLEKKVIKSLQQFLGI